MRRIIISFFILILFGIITACNLQRIALLPETLEEKVFKLSPSEVIFPKQEIPLRFFHDKHAKLELECIFCHRSVPNSTKSSDNNLPKGHTLEEKGQNVCAFCHLFWVERGRKPVPAKCDTCHAGFDPKKDKVPAKVVLPDPNIIFNHKKHIDNKIECQRCHGRIEEIELATRDHLPMMEKCEECHNGRTVVNNVKPPEECTTCHIADKRKILQTAFPTGDLMPSIRRPFYHDKSWVKNHRAQAEANVGVCENCHEHNFCFNCHRGGFAERGGFKKSSKIHPNDWITLHPKQAYANSFDCTSCHRLDTFCRDCHKRFSVRIDRFPEDRNFHIPGWPAFRVTENHHSLFAKRNIQPCMACHREEDCMQCHATIRRKGFGVNPHPTNFDRAGTIKRANKKVCLKCHVPGSF